MNFKATLKVSDLHTYIKTIIDSINELPEQNYSIGYVLQKAEPKMNISKEETIKELVALGEAVKQFTSDDSLAFEIRLPIFSTAEETALALINQKYSAIQSLIKPQLVKG